MREEMGLYKAKRKDTGKWIQGYLFCIWEKAYILWGTINGIPDMVEVNPDTVCEGTGLVDKNGVKIFEGDLVVPTNRRRLANKASVVEYDPLSGYWMCSPAREPLVIGNIHDKAVEE